MIATDISFQCKDCSALCCAPWHFEIFDVLCFIDVVCECLHATVTVF